MRDLSTKLKKEIFSEVSADPFLLLIRLNHESWEDKIYIVNNNEPIISQGKEYIPFPVNVKLPPDDENSERSIEITFDNVGLDYIAKFRSVSTPIKAEMEMILASEPDEVQVDIGQMVVMDINYNQSTIQARLLMDDFLNSELYSERYTPINFRGLF